jgi:hypothetical protein
VSEKSNGQIAYEGFYQDFSKDEDWSPPTWAELPEMDHNSWEAAAQAVIAARLDGLMPMGLHFDDADPVARCLVGDCKWHGHGDGMIDAVDYWCRHLAADHRGDWPDDDSAPLPRRIPGATLRDSQAQL